VSRKEKALWNEVSSRLSERSGWSLEPAVSPGQPPSWCFGGNVTELSVGVTEEKVSIYLVDRDLELTLADVDVMTGWLDDNESLFANRSSMRVEDFNAELDIRLAHLSAGP
jgi:hypothetical protein